jgi:hypothetical protein
MAQTPEQIAKAKAAKAKADAAKIKADAAAKAKAKADAAAKKKKLSLDENVRQNYSEFSYLLDDPTLFGPEIAALLREATDKEWTIDRFKGAVSATPYWQNTVQAAKRYDAAPDADKKQAIDAVKLAVNDITDLAGIPQAEIDSFLTGMARSNVQGDALKKMVYSFAFTKGKALKADQAALATKDAADIKSTIKSYGGTATDADVENYLTGGKKPADVAMIYKEKLKGQYPHLASQLDANLTFDDITKDYKTIAANVLETTSENIDFMKPEFMDSIAKRDDKGNTRQMSLGEWTQALKTDTRYGYAKTTGAKQEARAMVASIAKAFGKVR